MLLSLTISVFVFLLQIQIHFLRVCTVFIKSSVGNGPLPTRVTYALKSVYFFDFIWSNSKPVQAPAAVLDELQMDRFQNQHLVMNLELLRIILIYQILCLV
jgi:hypothetical protein